MLKTIKDLYKIYRPLVGEGFDKGLQYIKEMLPEMDILEFFTGKEYGTWTTPKRWNVKNAWIKHKGKKIIDFKKEPLSLMVGSQPIHGVVGLKELKEHLFYDPANPEVIPYTYHYYGEDWGFNTTAKQYSELKKGEYEVFINSEYTDGKLTMGQYTIKGGDREVIIMVHLDHPYQANDNLSGVAAAIELAKTLKCKHTVKIVFVPETIGSVVYAHTQDLSKVDFGITLDMVGNDNTMLMQETFGQIEKINKAGVMAMSIVAPNLYRKAPFRAPLGADEYIFNDPLIAIPTIFFSRYPYKEYHSSADTPKIIKEKSLKEIVETVRKTIKFIENDWIPVRQFKGPLMRFRYNINQMSKEEGRKYDYFFYLMDGNRSLLELAYTCQLDVEKMEKLLNKMRKDGFIKKKPIPTNISK
jgi:aminopeptidase-like protein